MAQPLVSLGGAAPHGRAPLVFASAADTTVYPIYLKSAAATPGTAASI